MRELIKRILKEEAEMTEMGISLKRLKTLQPKQYLVKSSAKEKKSAEKKEVLKDITKDVNSLYVKITEDLRNINWQDLTLNKQMLKGTNFYHVIFPSKIMNNIDELVSLYTTLEENNYTNLITPSDKIQQLVDDYFDVIEDENIYVYVDEPRNRSHFPQGLPSSLLGYNLGLKIYKKLLDDLSFIQSDPLATKEVQAIYKKLISSPDVNTILYKESTILIDRQIDRYYKIRILEESIYEKYLQNNTSRKLILDRTIILDSSLKKEIGVNRIQKMIDDIYYYAKENTRTPFADLDSDFY
jgi:hypothetical protein